jgi:hypothetical protein
LGAHTRIAALQPDMFTVLESAYKIASIDAFQSASSRMQSMWNSE